MSNYLTEAKQLIKTSVAATGFAEHDLYEKAGVLATIARVDAMEAQAEAIDRLAAAIEKLIISKTAES